MSKSISCIIPVYKLNAGNNESYFLYLLKSLKEASLSLMGLFEIIVVNDDKSRIGRDYIERLFLQTGLKGVLKYVENSENFGQAYSRNVGAMNARYDYVHFIDQDDYISETFYNEFIDSDNKDIYISSPYFSKDNHISPGFTKALSLYYGNCKLLSNMWLLMLSNLVYSPGQVILRKSVFEEVGGFPVLKHKGSDDFGLFYNLAFKRKTTCDYLAGSYFYYRIHQMQNSRLESVGPSADEFLDSIENPCLKEKIIIRIRKDKAWSIVCKLVYYLFFKRG